MRWPRSDATTWPASSTADGACGLPSAVPWSAQSATPVEVERPSCRSWPGARWSRSSARWARTTCEAASSHASCSSRGAKDRSLPVPPPPDLTADYRIVQFLARVQRFKGPRAWLLFKTPTEAGLAGSNSPPMSRRRARPRGIRRSPDGAALKLSLLSTSPSPRHADDRRRGAHRALALVGSLHGGSSRCSARAAFSRKEKQRSASSRSFAGSVSPTLRPAENVPSQRPRLSEGG